MTPPQAPPAIVSSTQQEAIDALNRLVAMQAWLADQQALLPALPTAPAVGGSDAYLAELDVYWGQTIENVPGAAPTSRLDALATRLADVMRDDAIVRAADGTLDTDASALAARFARSIGGALPADIEARTLRIGDVDYAGAVIVMDRNTPDLALLFMADRGWEAFQGLDLLHTQTEERLRQALARHPALPGVRIDDTQEVIANDHFVGSQVAEGNVFDALARRLAALQKDEVKDAWTPDENGALAVSFIDDVTAGLDLHGKIDVFSLLAEREARLVAAIHEQRLAAVPADVARGWRAAMDNLHLAAVNAMASARANGAEAPLTLAEFAHAELNQALSRRSIALDADDVQIEATGSETPAVIVAGNRPAVAPLRMSLAEFALRNTASLDARHLRVLTDTSSAGAQPPDVRTIRDIVRELDLAKRYHTYLLRQLADPAGRRLRTATMQWQRARMRVEAVDARVAMYLPSESSGFLDDREDRGFRFAEAVLDAPAAATRRTVGGHSIVARQVTYRGAAVSDVLVIGARDPRSVSRVVIYTPGAPDGKAWREFADRATAAREFFYAPAFEAYLLQRLPSEFAEPLPNGSGRRFRVSEATRRAQWVLAGPSADSRTMTEEAFDERVVDGDVLTAMFDAEIVRQARDVAWAGRTTAEADAQVVAQVARLVLRGLRGTESLLEDTVGSVGQALRATWQFYDSVKAGDTSRAFLDFTEAYTSSLSLAGWYAGTARAQVPRLPLRASRSATRTVDSGVRLPDVRQRFDARYATRHVDLANTAPDALGVHRLNGRRYIRQQDTVFEVSHDARNDVWRLARPNALDTTFPGPSIEPVQAGTWRLRKDFGLRGGWVDDAAFPQPTSRGIAGQELAGLSEFQLWTFQDSFGTRLRNRGEAHRLYWDVSTQATPRYVTLRQRTAWNDALRTARAAPAEPLPLDAQPGPGASWRILPAHEWPDSLWYYPSGFAGFSGFDGSRALPLQVAPGSGLRGLPVTTQSPASRVSGTSTANVPGARAQPWIQLHLDRYRTRSGPGGRPLIRVIEDRRGAEPVYVVQPGPGFTLNFLGLQPGDFTAGSQPLP